MSNKTQTPLELMPEDPVSADVQEIAPGETETKPFRRTLIEYGARREDVVCLTGDLTTSCEVDGFRARFPDRYFSMGMAEQNMMGAAGGLAREGKIPIVASFSVFVTRRPWEQIALAIAYPNLPVRLMGFLPGLTTPGGVSHQSIDDVALMRLLPNMTVVDLGDATEVETLWPVLDEIDGPVFCRVLRGEVPRLFDRPLEFNRVRVLSEGTDAVVITSGVTTETSLKALDAARDAGVGITHIHASTLKPFSDPVVVEAIARSTHGVVSVENHLVNGGLGSAVSDLISEQNLGRRLIRVGIRDTFTHGGSQPYLFEEYGIGGAAVIDAIEDLVAQRLDVDRDSLRDPTVKPLRAAVAEGL